MREFAHKVSTKIEKEGAQVILNEKDNSVTIMMDGKVQDVITQE
jgi:rRNA processing protein Krr1/Pno1